MNSKHLPRTLRRIRFILPMGCALLALQYPPSSSAQGTSFTYQGRLNDGANPATGIYDIRFTIYDAASAGNSVGSQVTSATTGVTNGLFTVALDPGVGVFTGPDRWLEIAVRTNASADPYSVLAPRQKLTAAPYAVTAGGMNGFVIQQNPSSPNLVGGFVSNAVNSGVVGATISGGGAAGTVNTVSGNFGTIAGGQLSTAGPNSFVGGGFANSATGFNGVVAGGQNNFATGQAAAVGGGLLNLAGAANSTVAGGYDNQIHLGADYATIGGGYGNLASGQRTTVAGGSANTSASDFAAVGGGQLNTANGYASFIGGGSNNAVVSDYSVVGGGARNTAGYPGLPYSTVGGGYGNNAGNGYATIGGGSQNIVSGEWGTVGGGVQNNAYTYGTVGGGQQNQAGFWSTVGGGKANYAPSYGAVVVGGGTDGSRDGQNEALGVASAVVGGLGNVAGSPGSFIGGGENNEINNANTAVIAGGDSNSIQSNSYSAMISGGLHNVIETNSYFATINGGVTNDIGSGSDTSVIGGGRKNLIWSHAYESVIAGGVDNWIESFANDSMIGGGFFNTVVHDAHHSVIGGGDSNLIQSNSVYATIGGGSSNQVSGVAATVPGGQQNIAAGQYSLAAGQKAQANHQGAFVWADSQNGPFSSTASNQFLIRAQGGVGIGTNNPQSALHVAGNITATGFAGSGAGLTGLSGTAIQSNSIVAGQISSGQVVKALNGFSDVVTIIGGSNTMVTTASNSIKITALPGTVVTNTGWGISGNISTVPGANFVGTLDYQPLEFKVNGQRAMRLEPSTSGSPNLIGGFASNSVDSSTKGAVIGGGGDSGQGNSIGAGANFGVIGGGTRNGVNSSNGVVAGGQNNTIATAASYSTITGGASNTAGGLASTVAGGQNNLALGADSFAAGQQAQALHSGSFVWADGQNQPLSSTSSNQFLIRAGGGVGIGTNNPQSPLHVVGNGSTPVVTLDWPDPNPTNGTAGGHLVVGGLTASLYLQGSGCPTYTAAVQNSPACGASIGLITQGPLADWVISDSALDLSIGPAAPASPRIYLPQAGEKVALVPNGGQVGIGTLNPQYPLDVQGSFPIARFLGTQNVVPAIYMDNPSRGSGEHGMGGIFFSSIGNGIGSMSYVADYFVDGDDALVFNVTGPFNSGPNASPAMVLSPDIMIVQGDVSGQNFYGTSFYSSSDRNIKENFSSVDSEEVLAKVAAMPVSRWNFKADGTCQHIGPMAQDFYAAFQVGSDDKHIATVDEEGVALAAIQGLNQKLETEARQKDAEIAALKSRLEKLERLLSPKNQDTR